jgi:hypothetical protein
VKVKTWRPDMTDKETADLAYWERNVLALHFAEGWYNDDVPVNLTPDVHETEPRFAGWRRVLSLQSGSITFHIPDDFDVGTLAEIERDWDGHTTEQKWERMLNGCGVVPT